MDDFDPGWTRLPSPPEVRTSAAAIWASDALVMWGGYVYTGLGDEAPQSDGYVFDAQSTTWKRTSDSPLSARTLPGFAWTGKEVLIWGGSSNTDLDSGTFLGDGAAYDPATDTWHELPSAPISARVPLSVWTGQEFLVWGSGVRAGNHLRDGAAYNPTTNTWRRIAEGPIAFTDSTAVWTGRQMFVFGASLDRANGSKTQSAVGAAYNPRTNDWRRLPDSRLSPQASTASWNGTELIAWDYLNHAAAYDPEAGVWRGLSRVPLHSSECSPSSVAVEKYVFGNYCGSMILLKPGDKAWSDVTERVARRMELVHSLH